VILIKSLVERLGYFDLDGNIFFYKMLFGYRLNFNKKPGEKNFVLNQNGLV